MLTYNNDISGSSLISSVTILRDGRPMHVAAYFSYKHKNSNVRSHSRRHPAIKAEETYVCSDSTTCS